MSIDYVLDCTVGTTGRFLSSVSPFIRVESNSGVADPGAAAARPGTRVVEWLCAELPDCSSMFERLCNAHLSYISNRRTINFAMIDDDDGNDVFNLILLDEDVLRVLRALRALRHR